MLNELVAFSDGWTQRRSYCRDAGLPSSEHEWRLVCGPHRGVLIRDAFLRLRRPGAPTRDRGYDKGRAWVRDRTAGHVGVGRAMNRAFRGMGAASLIDGHGANRAWALMVGAHSPRRHRRRHLLSLTNGDRVGPHFAKWRRVYPMHDLHTWFDARVSLWPIARPMSSAPGANAVNRLALKAREAEEGESGLVVASASRLRYDDTGDAEVGPSGGGL